MGVKKKFYDTYAEARVAAHALNLKSPKEYVKAYKQDPLLPSNPDKQYIDFVSYEDFLGYEVSRPNFYTYSEARMLIQELGISGSWQYLTYRKKDKRLPSNPALSYKADWINWEEFTGVAKKYSNYEEAKKSAQSFGFSSANAYRKSCLKYDSRLLTSPDEWLKGWISWEDYLGLRPREPSTSLLSYGEAKKLINDKNIKTAAQYRSFRKFNQGLPSHPQRTWNTEWIDWNTFLTAGDDALTSYLRTTNKVRALGIRTEREYLTIYRDYDDLPKHPETYFKDNWRGWKEFLGEYVTYQTLEEAAHAAREIGIKTKSEYEQKCSQDPKLPLRPDIIYKTEWGHGWRAFLSSILYPTKEEAAAAARKLNIVDGRSYRSLRSADIRLPADPYQYYGNWHGWLDFLLPKKCLDLNDVKYCIRALGIKNSKDYRKSCDRHKCLPHHPERVFKTEWKDWYDTCSIVRPYTYEEAKELIRGESLTTSTAYRFFVSSSGDERLPLTPDKVYKDEWTNWAVFLGKPEPYVLTSLRSPLEKWRNPIAEFLRNVKKGHKEYFLVYFVREFIVPLGLSEDPNTFYSTRGFDIDTFLSLAKSLPASRQAGLISTMREFTTWYITANLCITCEETGESVLIEGVRDPFSRIQSEDFTYKSNNQTLKPALAYQYVAAIRDWIIPHDANSFSDLKHLQCFDKDWIIVDKSLIDPSDKDCIYKEENGIYRIWYPGWWMHAYALSSVPIRGMQIAYADSGEADAEIPIITNGQIEWVANQSPLKCQTDRQGFVKQYPNNELGMHLTTNKTSTSANGYDVPWIPENLALWMVRLRIWQSKYNPIDRTMPWIDCNYTNLSESDREKKQNNCFLFRELGEEECSSGFSGRLHRRIAIALHHTTPHLSTLDGDPNRYTSYDSIYTPHTMRVSLITAYVMEFRLPLSVIVKIVGHSSIIMTIYYVKINGELLRQKFSEGEKRALSDQAKALYQSIQQKRSDSVKDRLITNNEEAIRHLVGDIAAGSALFRDYGICPFASSRCGDGFESMGKFIPVPAGYLGIENCPRCRHFVTGPVFLGGLLSLANEISLTAKIHFEHLESMEYMLTTLKEKIVELENQQYDAEISNQYFDPSELVNSRMEIESIYGQIASASAKADMYLCDMNAINRICVQCQSLINTTPTHLQESGNTQLIVQPDYEAVIEFEDVSLFHQYQEVCENAEIYVSAKADAAVSQRSQLIDRMAELNNLTPSMYRLNSKQQLHIGNQVIKFLVARLKSFEKVDALMNGEISFSELPQEQRLTSATYKRLLSGASAQEVLFLQKDGFDDSSQASENYFTSL